MTHNEDSCPYKEDAEKYENYSHYSKLKDEYGIYARCNQCKRPLAHHITLNGTWKFKHPFLTDDKPIREILDQAQKDRQIIKRLEEWIEESCPVGLQKELQKILQQRNDE